MMKIPITDEEGERVLALRDKIHGVCKVYDYEMIAFALLEACASFLTALRRAHPDEADDLLNQHVDVLRARIEQIEQIENRRRKN